MTPPAGTPWWAWLIAVVVAALIAAVASVLAAHVMGRRTRQDVTEIKHQVKNSHAINLRDDIDALRTRVDQTHALAADAAEGAKTAAQAAARTDRYVADVAKSVRSLEHSLDRRDARIGREIEEVRKDLDQHLEDIPRLTAAAVQDHVHDCPLRTPGRHQEDT